LVSLEQWQWQPAGAITTIIRPTIPPAWRQALWGRVSILSQSFAEMLVAHDEKEG
jgi:hypothetical protein